MRPLIRTLVLLACVVACGQGVCQSLYYTEPHTEPASAACPVRSAPTAVTPRKVQSGAPVNGSISINCGFSKGSYTVTLSSTDPGAKFSPKSFLVNFGNLVGDGAFTVTFATVGVQAIAAAITSNMGSPAVAGRFASTTNEFDVVRP